MGRGGVKGRERASVQPSVIWLRQISRHGTRAALPVGASTPSPVLTLADPRTPCCLLPPPFAACCPHPPKPLTPPPLPAANTVLTCVICDSQNTLRASPLTPPARQPAQQPAQIAASRAATTTSATVSVLPSALCRRG